VNYQAIFLMVVKNNYFGWKESREAGFIANGDIIEISKFLILRNCMVLSLPK
jgi:hypothetical protein